MLMFLLVVCCNDRKVIILFFFKGGSTDAVHSGLARQVSSLLTNHLARATECCGNQAAGNDALQDVLSLLNDLSR